MRTPIIAGNWKMYKTPDEAVAFVRELAPMLAPYATVERVVCPTFVCLPGVRDALKGTDIGVGAQNVYWEDQGAFTGEVSPTMLAGLVDYVIIGHSERREYFGETDATVNYKIKAALAHGLKPIVCVGESLEQNRAGETAAFVGAQVRAAFANLDAGQMRDVVIAYEPIWAIGTGLTATGEDANAIIRDSVRGVVADLFGDAVAQALRIQYGGSVKPDNMAEFMAQPEIDGALVGGASLKADSFTALVRVAAELKGGA
ncbi:MAG: triose-phosphate isomerase [Anaerolineae bacterium]|nr:triose-phosphate isomerase [Anaerolineae bacterium]